MVRRGRRTSYSYPYLPEMAIIGGTAPSLYHSSRNVPSAFCVRKNNRTGRNRSDSDAKVNIYFLAAKDWHTAQDGLYEIHTISCMKIIHRIQKPLLFDVFHSFSSRKVCRFRDSLYLCGVSSSRASLQCLNRLGFFVCGLWQRDILTKYTNHRKNW